eukprot:scaffold47_cov334-Pavlova_lutheri.AAC.13
METACGARFQQAIDTPSQTRAGTPPRPMIEGAESGWREDRSEWDRTKTYLAAHRETQTWLQGRKGTHQTRACSAGIPRQTVGWDGPNRRPGAIANDGGNAIHSLLVRSDAWIGERH